MRPLVLDDIVGQDHIVGPGRLLRRAIQADRLSSVIFYGPPGTGKTSLARVIANTTSSVFESLNAVLTGIKDIREVIDRSDERLRLYTRRTILFVDEVHRWNKAQQDALLPWVENGTVILIGATTENPFFEVNRALVSRSRIFQLKSLEAADLMKAAERCLSDKERGYGNWKIVFEKGALEHLVEVAGGDARSLLNALELAVETSAWDKSTLSFANGETQTRSIADTSRWPPPEGTEIRINLEAAEESIQRRALLYDRDGDYHFDTISAFIKSVRGSDPDAALYWLAKMVRAGEDPAFIFRRMIILAMEDVGLADPDAITCVISCAQAFDRIGFPEGNFALSQACLRLATAAKSNTTMAFFDAIKEVEREDAEVPNHLKDPSRDAESLGHGKGYIYPHAYREHWAAQQYLPAALRGRVFYTPSLSGCEAAIRDEVLRKRELQAALILGRDHSRGLSGDQDSGRSKLLNSDRDRIFAQCDIKADQRILIAAANDGLLLWEGQRRLGAGLAAAVIDSEGARKTLLGLSENLDQAAAPLLAVIPGGLLPTAEEAEKAFSCRLFDHILAREPWRRTGSPRAGNEFGPQSFEAFAQAAAKLLAPGGDVSLLQSPPRLGQRLSRLIFDGYTALADALSQAEEDFFDKNSAQGSFRWAWDAEDLSKSFVDAGFSVKISLIDQSEERIIGEKDLSLWFEKERSSWGAFIAGSLGEKDFLLLRELMEKRAREGPVRWDWKSLLLLAKKI
ncbi:MAG: AAA family ATPase [Treponema sp.]|nr:AAA family ATPase [Treponema sp.]